MSQSTGHNFWNYYYNPPIFLLLSNYTEQCNIRKQNFYPGIVSPYYMFDSTMPYCCSHIQRRLFFLMGVSLDIFGELNSNQKY